MTTPHQFTHWYWVQSDSNPTTHVWASATGAQVTNTDATYVTWLTDLADVALSDISTTVTGAANNGSGLIRLTITDGGATNWATGDRKTVASVGGTTEANGSWVITKISETAIDLQGSTFTNTYTSGGVIGSASSLTVAQTNTLLNEESLSGHLKALSTAFNHGVNDNTSASSAVDIVLTNPAKRLQYLSFSAASKYLWLPPVNVPVAVPIGFSIKVFNAGTTANKFGIKDSAGSIIIPVSGDDALQADEVVELTLRANDSAAGTWFHQRIMFGEGTGGVRGIQGGHADTTKPDGSILVWNGGTTKFDATTLGAGIATWLATPSSANLASAITDETGSGALVFAAAPAFTGDITQTSTSAGANGPGYTFFHNSASPAANDTLGYFIWSGKDSGANTTTYCALAATLLDPTNGSEDAVIRFDGIVAGAYGSRWFLGGALYSATATGGDTGVETINVKNGYYLEGTKVVGARDTGWAAMTGTPDEGTSYDTASVTLPQLAGRVAAIQAALTTHGLIGA